VSEMRNIQVFYDGKYPCTCMGTLRIVEDGQEIYCENYCCSSTGSVWFDSDWDEHVEEGSLVWNDADKFDAVIQSIVEDCLEEYHVCCGGCV